jgi:uncharacterized protein
MRYPGLSKLRQQLPVGCVVDAPAPEGTGEAVLGPVRGEILLSPTGRTILAQGHLRAVVEMACARCLRPHPVPLDIEVARECSLLEVDDPEAYRDTEDDLPPVPIANGDEIDLGELVRQFVIVNTPPRSICSPDCQGLCAQCGADLNAGPCACEPRHGDPRLAVLRSLLDEA